MKLYKPMLASSADEPFSSKEWLFEAKWDGIRALAYVDSKFSLRSRNLKELKQNFPELEELKMLAKDAVLDGEIVVMSGGLPDFQRTVERNQLTSPMEIDYMEKKFPATYIVFDILEKDGKPLVDLSLSQRKEILKVSLKEGDFVVLSEFIDETGLEYFKAAMKMGMEGIIAKKKASRYVEGKRSKSWLKIKKIKTVDCAIFGYTKGKTSSSGIGALLLGLYEGNKPVYIGKVGSGFSQKIVKDLLDRFKKLKTHKRTLEGVSIKEEVFWLKPALVCEIGYQELTKDGKLRIPRFIGLRIDKKAPDCKIDQLRPEKNLHQYRLKRNFKKTTEPIGENQKAPGKSFVVHEHHARRLHYDLRLERDGVLKSWAVPKGPPEQHGIKHLAVQVEDHPLEYGGFEGVIPKGEYGAGQVNIWDKGLYEPLIWTDDKVEFLVKGKRLEGRYVLVRLKKAGEKEWLFFKAKD